ncbi:UvrD-helicase domain-containing protein [Flavobacteriales bacterium]|nr:UvrD-helicase domain-containing protein [Flavobacteriales bacterium]
MAQNLQIFRSSAGSGKTYTLALSFIALALKGDRYGYEDYYRKILAITFTNKAAAEMKERVLEYLDSLAAGNDKDGILDWLLETTSLDQIEIFKRSEVVHKHILHHYADLGISTIDKFTYKIVRTFAADLGLSHNFDLEMDNYKIIQPVVALLLSKISDGGGDLSNALVNFAIQKAEEGKSTNIEHDLEEFAQHLFKEEVSKYTDSKRLTLKECMQVRKDLQLTRIRIVKEIGDLADDVCDYFNINGLTNDHFLRGTYYKHFTNNVGSKDDTRWKPSDALKRNIAANEWYAKGKPDAIKQLVKDCKVDLEQFYNDLIDLLNEYNSVKSVLKNIYSIAILNELIFEVRMFKKENNIEQISEFNKKINRVVTNQPSAFIYERLGERYNHYLIDEFQDTSLLQWQNILPLITDSLDYGKSLVVGDGKQSIYRWRGGEAEQFFELPNIYNGDQLIFKKEWEDKLNTHFKQETLKHNFRSRKNIIEFNNQFFENTKDLLSNDLLGIYDDHKQDPCFSKKGGYIHIELFGDKSNFKDLILEKMISQIKKLNSDNNYRFEDITILCNSRKSVAMVAESLSLNNIPVISNEGLLISKSDKVNALIAILQYLQNPKNDIAKTVIADYLFSTILKDKNLHALNINLKTDKGFIAILKEASIFIHPSKLLQEPLYEMVEQIIRGFNFKEDVYLGFFLDMVLVYTEKQGSSLTEFLIWWEERKLKEAIVVPEGTDAVRVMTIHKSKGLAFDVVMIPFNWEDRKKVQDIWVDTSNYFNKALPSALINANIDLNNSYFNAEYLKEKEMSLLDSLNKLYVAMTRPKERLYIFSKSLPDKIPDNFKNKGDLNSFLYAYDTHFPLIVGDADMMHVSKVKNRDTFSVSSRNKLDWREVISLKHTAEEIWDIETVNAKRDWGKLLHLALADIHYTEQKNEVIERMYKAGRCIKEDYEKLKVSVKNLLSHPEVMPFFTSEWEVKTEKEILMENGRTYIPDRLLFSKKTEEVIVVDYKTGEEKDKHTIQITEYADALKLMGKKDVKRVLIYTSDPINVMQL